MPGDHRVQSEAEPTTSPGRRLIRTAIEVVLAVALATGAVALLEPTAPATRLEVLYLLAVLAVAIRRGERAALISALLSGLVVNYLFLTPRHQLAIAHSRDVVELVVVMIVAIVVGRLAATSRQRAAEAESRAHEAASREREATLLAGVASAIVAGRNLSAALESIGQQVAEATGAGRARVTIERVPEPEPDELMLALRVRTGAAWLYVGAGTGWPPGDLERLCEPLGRLLDVAIERERLADVAAETEAERRVQTARTAILHTLSHDLRSPLTAIITAGSALRERSLDAADHAELLDVIELEGARLAQLMSDLLDLSKIQAGAVMPQPDWCDLQDIVATAAAGVPTAHPIDFAIPHDLPLVRADASQMERVFSNLIENAVKFSPADRPVRVTAGAGAGRVTVRVIDQGRGIPGPERARVFEPFFRGRGTAGAGSGLGLAICRGFAEANGGQIVLQTGTDQGTSFAVSLPLVPQPVAGSLASR
jgi:two-component system sensor histidine kinase KdpD